MFQGKQKFFPYIEAPAEVWECITTQELLGLIPGENEECAELSPAVQARMRLSPFRARFWQLLDGKAPLQPSMSRSPFSAVSCHLWYLSPLPQLGFLELAGLNNWFFCALTPSGAAQSMDKLMLQLRDRGTPPACRVSVQFCVKRRLTASTAH